MIRVSASSRKGFTLVEIMIVVAIIALLASIAVPNFLRSRKRAQATLILEDLRQMTSALDQHAIEFPKERPDWESIKKYLKAGTRLYECNNTDIFGHGFHYDSDTRTQQVNPDTFSALSDVAPTEFWKPYIATN